ncbi:MAG: DegT/DnrJ/EryC1/StrS family aminotransferase [Phycisphaeraceae bacterium]|nr:DegT/DnrJ/EryC1/StrS family aminotransferase [Phycisphaeraceae bacterium]
MFDEIPLSSPDITEAEIHEVVRVLRSGRLSIGPVLEEFERLVADRVGTTHAVGVSTGTAGLHLSLLALGIGPGDEVITTPFSFIASTNCILYVGARPVFVDIDPTSLNMDPAQVEAAITPRTKAILAVEVFGDPTHMEAYRTIAARHEIPLIEDSCEGLGGRGCSKSGRRNIGAYGRVGVFGFYPNKQITTGEGGMIVTDDDRLADLCRSMRNQGRAVSRVDLSRHDPPPGGSGASWLSFERLGFNYRMNELSAALGVAQMRRLDEILRKRREVVERYTRRLLSEHRLVLPNIDDAESMSWFVYVVRLTNEFSREERDRIMAGMRRHDIGCADYFPCIHLQPHVRNAFGHKPGDFPIAESVSRRTIALPFHNNMTDRDVDLVAQTLELMLAREGLRGM